MKLKYTTSVTLAKYGHFCSVYRGKSGGKLRFYPHITPSSRKRLIRIASNLPFHGNDTDAQVYHWFS